jgi:FecR protein
MGMAAVRRDDLGRRDTMDAAELLNEMVELTLASKADDATDEQRARLEVLLADEPQAIPLYLRIVDDTLTMRAAAVRDASTNDSECSCSEMPIESDDVGKQRVFSPSMLKYTRSVPWAIAGCLLFLLVSTPWWWTTGERVAVAAASDKSKSARVVSVSKVQWADGAKQFSDWSFVQPGDVMRFNAGLVNLFLSNGVEVLIEGPADVTFVSLEKVFARQGKLAARVGPGAIGFRIETPHAKVIDRGTAFGMSVDGKSRTSVIVYEGVVDLDVVGGPAQSRRTLEKGEGLSISENGELSRINSVQNADFLEPPQARAATTDPGHVIDSVSDNMRSLETTKYYRVIPRGFVEDCRAYVDRDHEWNGLDDRGLPPFLVGGDYVMTFNDDKIVTEFEMAVTLNQPAALYVLVDDRVAPPEWLKRDFVDTHWDVGSDESFPDRIIESGVGPGKCIDHVCSVWRRDVPDASTVVLGALSREESDMPAMVVERSMYGIVAVPLNSRTASGIATQELSHD